MCFIIVSMAAKWIKNSLDNTNLTAPSPIPGVWLGSRLSYKVAGFLPFWRPLWLENPRSDFLERCQLRSILSFWRPCVCRSQQSRVSNSDVSHTLHVLPASVFQCLTASAPFLSLLRTLWLHWDIDNNVHNLRVCEGHQESMPGVPGLRVKVWMFLWGDVTWRPRLLPCELAPLHSGCLSARSVT